MHSGKNWEWMKADADRRQAQFSLARVPGPHDTQHMLCLLLEAVPPDNSPLLLLNSGETPQLTPRMSVLFVLKPPHLGLLQRLLPQPSVPLYVYYGNN